MTYNRNDLPADIYSQYSSKDLTYAEALEIANIIIDRANETFSATKHDTDGNIVYPFNFKELCDMMKEEYKRLDNRYFSSYTPSGKRIINKTIMSELHITGVFFAPFGEANVNGNENNLYLPHTLAHEIAHSKGVMKEFQADIVSCYVLLQSDNPYLSYGAYVQCLNSALNIVSLYPDSKAHYDLLEAKVNDAIYTERRNYTAFYSQFHHFDDLGDFLNDIYLKLQKQPDGSGSYVKPGEIIDTGNTDNDGRPIVEVVNFSGMQNLLITLYKQGKLA